MAKKELTQEQEQIARFAKSNGTPHTGRHTTNAGQPDLLFSWRYVRNFADRKKHLVPTPE